MRRRSTATPTFAGTFLRHVAVGAVLLAAVAVVTVLVSMRVGREQALREPVAGGQVIAVRIAPLVTPGVYQGDSSDLQALSDAVQARMAASAINRVKIWSADGVILYSDDPRLIGLRYPLDRDRRMALTGQGVESMVADLSRSDNVLDRPLGQSLEVSAGARDVSGRPILVETYFAVDQLDADETSLIHTVELVILGSLLLFGLLLFAVAYSLARRVAKASRE